MKRALVTMLILGSAAVHAQQAVYPQQVGEGFGPSVVDLNKIDRSETDYITDNLSIGGAADTLWNPDGLGGEPGIDGPSVVTPPSVPEGILVSPCPDESVSSREGQAASSRVECYERALDDTFEDF